MPQYTDNYGLIKPYETENYDVEVQNSNMDKIDLLIKTAEDKTNVLDNKLEKHKEDYAQQRQQDQLKVAKVEKELNDYKATMQQVNINQEPKQKATGYGVISLPPNAAEGQVSVTVKGNTETDEEGNTKSTVGAVRIKSVGKNLFDKNRALKGYFLNFTNGIQEPYSSPSFCSDFIRVDSNEQYYVTGFLGKGYTFIAFYDSNKNFTRRTLASSRYNILISDIQDHEKYIRITVYDNVNSPATWQDIDDVLNNLQVERGNVATPYEPYRESNVYIIAKDPEAGEILELRSLPNGTKDEVRDIIRITKGKAELIRKVGNKKDVPNGTVINYADMADDGVFEAWGANGEHIVGVKGDTLDFDAVELNYQLAEPVEIPMQVNGTLLSYPSGTVYVENVVTDAGLYSDGITVLHQDLPIKSIEKISKIDYETGLETILDASKAVIASDKLSFTHPDLKDGDIVFFIYEYDRESTIPEVEVEFYDSRYVVKDSATGKFYKWSITVTNGTPSIQLTEV